MKQVPATEFAKRFSQYRQAAQREPVAVTHHSRITEVLISKTDFDEFMELKRRATRAVFAWELSDDAIAAVSTAAMDSRHAHLDELMDEQD